MALELGGLAMSGSPVLTPEGRWLLPSGERVGAQRPRVESVPEFAETYSGLAASLMELAGKRLDEWQRFVLDGALGVQGGGRFSAFEVALNVPRQN